MHAAVDESRIPELEEIVRLALDEARRRGAAECEVDASLNQGIAASVRLGEVDTVEYQRDRGLGITVYFGKRKGSASTADLAAGGGGGRGGGGGGSAGAPAAAGGGRA